MLFSLKSNTDQAIINKVPPIGVIIPRIDILYIDIMYKDPEKRTIPEAQK